MFETNHLAPNIQPENQHGSGEGGVETLAIYGDSGSELRRGGSWGTPGKCEAKWMGSWWSGAMRLGCSSEVHLAIDMSYRNCRFLEEEFWRQSPVHAQTQK